MKIQEALKSGKRFKRPNDTYWVKKFAAGEAEDELFLLRKSDVLANDWEVEEKISFPELKLYNDFQKLSSESRQELLDMFSYQIKLKQECEQFNFKKEYD